MAEENWTIAEAKARFSELIDRANANGPQTITRHGRTAAVVVSAEEWERKTKRRSNLVELKIGEDSHSNNQNHSESKAPLVYYRGKYRHLARDYQRPSLAAYYDEDFE